ncbi:MAG: hypothetical protein KAU24_03050 [Candidatus Aenigmarchaeota archaeon]|nr:hypothetical protein [Candidatus Aenigmarchaeota archaeon]
MGKENLKIKSDYYSRIEMPWIKGKSRSPLESYDLTLEDLKNYLEKGNQGIKGIKVGRKDDSIIVKYKGKEINLTPIEEFVELPVE